MAMVTVCNNKGDKWFEVTYVEDNVYTIDEITGKRNEERNRSRFLISVKNIIDGKVMEVGKTEREPFEAEEKEGSPVVIPGGFREVGELTLPDPVKPKARVYYQERMMEKEVSQVRSHIKVVVGDPKNAVALPKEDHTRFIVYFKDAKGDIVIQVNLSVYGPTGVYVQLDVGGINQMLGTCIFANIQANKRKWMLRGCLQFNTFLWTGSKYECGPNPDHAILKLWFCKSCAEIKQSFSDHDTRVRKECPKHHRGQRSLTKDEPLVAVIERGQ